MARNGRYCWNCDHYEQTFSGGEEQGLCHWRAPTRFPGELTATWPTVFGADYCGEWEADGQTPSSVTAKRAGGSA